MGFDYQLSVKEQARLDLLTDKLVSDLSAEGITIDDRAALADLPSVRLFVLSDHDAGGALDEAKRLPAVVEQIRRRDLAAAMKDPESNFAKDVQKLNASQRVTLGYDLEASRRAAEAAQPKRQMTAEEEAMKLLALRQISHPATRLAMAREWGLA